MKIGFYDPYFDSLGGGERYVLTLASHWSKSHTVDVFWDDADILTKAQDRLGIDTSSLHSVPNVFAGKSVFKKIFTSSKYDCIFFLTDGSIPTSFAKRNILHFQVPFARIPLSSWKMSRFSAVVCNSEFTKTHLDARIGASASVIYPPVEAVPASKKIQKEDIVLSVGRFSPNKRHDALIDAFRSFIQKKAWKSWKLVLAGGVLPSDHEYFMELKGRAIGLPVTFLPNGTHAELDEAYNKAKIYWHAAGYHATTPAAMEHFGITTVEAMSAGVVPLSYKAGGQVEIITEGKNGMLWTNVEELVERTETILRNMKAYTQMVKGAKATVVRFSKKKFLQAYDELLAGVTHE